jgi:hypothetical protein
MREEYTDVGVYVSRQGRGDNVRQTSERYWWKMGVW